MMYTDDFYLKSLKWRFTLLIRPVGKMYIKQLLDVKWSTLSSLSRQKVVQMTVLVPIFGYMIILSDWVKEHFTIFGQVQTGKMLIIYYGFTSLAIASLIYTWRCPKLIKIHGDSHTYLYKESGFLIGHKLRITTISAFELWHNSKKINSMNMYGEKFTRIMAYFDSTYREYGLEDVEDKVISVLSVLEGDHHGGQILFDNKYSAPRKEDLMRAYFSLLDDIELFSRKLTLFFYLFGFFLLSIPTIRMFYEVGEKAMPMLRVWCGSVF